jgi:xanthine dehydrogenase accessory factor
MALITLIRGGGDLASGVAMRLYRAGLRLIITELPQPLVVRRYVSFAEAVYSSTCQVDGVKAVKASDLDHALQISGDGHIPVLVDPEANSLVELRLRKVPLVLVEARMTKLPPTTPLNSVSLVIGLGPGCVAGQNCHACVETNRGHQLGRVLWEGATEMDTGEPDSVLNQGGSRVLRAPIQGLIQTCAHIGQHVETGDVIAEVDGMSITAPFPGVIRGLIHSGLRVWNGLKIGDVDPRDEPRYCYLVSDKALAVGGGVLEAILSTTVLRPNLWD